MRILLNSVLRFGVARMFEACLFMLAFAMLWASSTAAQSQSIRDFDSKPTIGDPYGRDGMHSGSLAFFPALAISTAFGDQYDIELDPSLTITGRWGDTSLEATGSGNVLYDNDTVEFADLLVAMEFGLDHAVSKNLTVEFDASYSDERSRPDWSSSLDDREQRVDAYAGIELKSERVIVKFDAGMALSAFKEHRTYGRLERTYLDPELALRVTARSRSRFDPFIEAAYVPRIYLQGDNGETIKRNYDGFEVIAGVEFKESAKLSGEAGIIYMEHGYADHFTGSTRALGLNVDMTLHTGEASELIFSAATSIHQGAFGSIAGSPIYAARLEARHELRDDVRLEASLDVEIEANAHAPDIVTLTPDIGLIWQFHKNAAWTSNLEATWERTIGGGDAEISLFLKTGLELRL